MLEQNPEKRKNSEEILNEFEEKILKAYKPAGRFQYWHWRLKPSAKFLTVFIIFFAAVISFWLITLPPTYSDQQTKINEKILWQNINKAGKFAPRLRRALILLKKYPNYYKKVVNSFNDIEMNTKLCPYMCVQYFTKIKTFSDLLFADRKVEKNPKLFINPKTTNYYRTDYDVASVLIHEADHIEYARSNRLRKAALFIKCNPIFNTQISVQSRLADLQHRIDPVEICAEKEEIKFHKLTNTPSGYEVEHGLIYDFFYSLISDIKFFLNFIF